jgi:hypothetical protein
MSRFGSTTSVGVMEAFLVMVKSLPLFQIPSVGAAVPVAHEK